MTATAKTEDNAMTRTPSRRGPRPWRAEMLLVDFRHAFWPWLIYTLAVFSIWLLKEAPFSAGPDTPNYWPWIMAVIALAAPAAVARIFATDFAHGTTATILSSPRPRSAIFWSRFALAAALLLLPAAIVAVPLPHPWTTWNSVEQYLLSAAVVTVIMMALFYTAIGALLSITLKRPLLVWSATAISPLVVLIFLVIVEGLTGINLGIQAGEQLESSVGLQFWTFLCIDTVAILLAWRQWLRLEVR